MFFLTGAYLILFLIIPLLTTTTKGVLKSFLPSLGLSEYGRLSSDLQPSSR